MHDIMHLIRVLPAASFIIVLACSIHTAWAGGPPATSIDPGEPLMLQAGPVSVKFQDGQLRYLRVGDREIVRRIYFAVRDGNWATIPPRFTNASLVTLPGGFEIALSAECRRAPVDFTWSGRITGSNDGKITFYAEGTPGADFQSNRIGLCVLYGSPSLGGLPFETFATPDAKGEAVKADFPHLVSPDLVGNMFHLLRYTAPEGFQVSCAADGATFDMEDQRNWGDSSYKAYAPLPYDYPSVKKGQKLEQTITLAVNHVAGLENYRYLDTIHFRIGKPIEGAKVPKLVAKDKSFNGVPSFVDVNRNREKYVGAKEVTWSYTSATHLPDDDTQMENPPALVDQAQTIRSFVPNAALRVGPVQLPRSKTGLAAAWSVEVLKHLSVAGVDTASLDLRPGEADAVLADIGTHQGKPVLPVEPVLERGSVKQAWAVQTLAVRDGDATIIWLANRTPEKARAVIEGLGTSARVTPLNAANSASGGKTVDVAAGGTVELDAYGVYRVETKP